MNEIGISKNVRRIFKFLDDNTKRNIDEYIKYAMTRNYSFFNCKEDFENIFSFIDEYLESISEDNLLEIRSYTGYNFRNINNILRGTWNYDENGLLTDEIKNNNLHAADVISKEIAKFPHPQANFVTYRGSNIKGFHKYGITELSDLKNLKDKFLYEEGFTSTSFMENSCFFGKQNEYGKNCNIEVRYFITDECNDGIFLANSYLSYSDNQNEYLLDKNTLSKVINVDIDSNNNTAVISAIVIPKKLWNLVEARNFNR